MELIEFTRVCGKCEKRKNWKSGFHRSKWNKFGVSSICKVCISIYVKNNKEERNKYNKAYREANKEKTTVRLKIYYETNKEKIKARQKEHRKTNPKKEKIRHANYHKKNKDKIKTRQKIYSEANPKTIKAIHKKNNDKQKLKLNFKLNSNMSGNMRNSLKNGNGKNGHHWETLVPYNLNDLIKRLKKTLPAGYSWDDYINGKTDLQIDHIIPVSKHNFKSYTDTDFYRCWALKNLQLLPALENISKGAKLKKPFQPSLLL